MAILNARKLFSLNFGILLLFITSVGCLDNLKSRSSVLDSSDRWKASEMPTSGSSLWTPEYYDGPETYKKDFITSNYDDKYSKTSAFYPSKTHHGFSPFSSGNLYSSSGYDRRPVHGTVRPIDFGLHDYESLYDHTQQAQGYGLSQPYGSRDLTKSLWIPFAGAALLGIAAALVVNPVLLHFGVSAGKRKRRSVSFKAHSLAYSAQTWLNQKRANKGQYN